MAVLSAVRGKIVLFERRVYVRVLFSLTRHKSRQNKSLVLPESLRSA